jgi:hypothetical protein
LVEKPTPIEWIESEQVKPVRPSSENDERSGVVTH